ncbi:MAG TPA: LD-carboxypeptidase [Gemmatimonadales bacterium]|nr:LD-carboxypeptidase [Gemmatimonadales bacterium]
MGSKAVIRPPRLAAGCRVALIAPSGPLPERDDHARAAELCRALGYEPVPGPNAARRHGYLAGTDAERLADLNAALGDGSIDAVWCLRGGYGLTRILDGVDFAALARRPKPVVGFSDVSVLLNAITGETRVVAFHGPTARQPLGAFTRRHFERVLGSAEPAGRLERVPPPPDVLAPRAPRIATLRGGRAEGPLAGGNLSLLQCLVGTRWFPDLAGALLFLEDVGEELYRIDRMLSHLRLAGVLAGVAGVVVGQFTEMPRASDGGLDLDDVLEHYLAPLGVPVARGFPIGHMDEQWTLPLGVRARLDADAGELALLDPAVA